MIPDWMQQTDEYQPAKDSMLFITKTIQALGKAMARLRIQKGHEKNRTLPAIVKLAVLIILLILITCWQNRWILIGIAIIIQIYLCFWPARDIISIYKSAFLASVIAFLMLLPAMIMKPEGSMNEWMIVCKVFVSMEAICIFNHTTQWNHVTSALQKLHVPAVFIFTLDITLKFIVLLGTLICDLLTALQLRCVGKNNKKYQSIGGVMGVTFLKSVQMNKEMYEAMQCRGFTDDYKG